MHGRRSARPKKIPGEPKREPGSNTLLYTHRTIFFSESLSSSGTTNRPSSGAARQLGPVCSSPQQGADGHRVE